MEEEMQSLHKNKTWEVVPFPVGKTAIGHAMIIASKSKVGIDRLKIQLNEEFETKVLGAAKKKLGMEIRRERSRRKLFFSQKGHIQRVIEKFGMKGAKSVMTPLAPHFKFFGKQSPTTAQDKAYMDNVPYASGVGSMV
uniref:Reverse transcriptase Ty1/copia-type domain-containing protein n=1 Tax=Chenopodium quinoa TaxID=63459 RepID=A0A803MQP9_CHEQI